MGLQIPPDFDWQFYLYNNPDLVEAGIESKSAAEEHYLAYGFAEGRLYKALEPVKFPELVAIYQRVLDFREDQFEIITNHRLENAQVSVIITLFNYEDFIETCIESVLANDFENLEIVVVNDASTDQSLRRAAQFLERDCNLTIIDKKVNTGLVHSRNMGIDICVGTYVFILDADNSIYPDCLESHYSKMQEDDFSACYGVIDCYDEDNNFVKQLSADPFDEKRLRKGNYIDAMAMFDKKKLLAIGKYDEGLIQYGIGWEDYELWLRIAKESLKVGFIKKSLCRYLMKSDSMLQKTNKYYFKNLEYYLYGLKK